jgi:hypothetical protein
MLLNWKDRLPQSSDDGTGFLKRHFGERLQVSRSKTRSSQYTVTPPRRFLRRSKSTDTVTLPKRDTAQMDPPIASDDDSNEVQSDPEGNLLLQHPQPGDRFERVIKAMQDVHLSCSPGVHHDPPQLLLRLRERELEEKDNIVGWKPGSKGSYIASNADELTSQFARPFRGGQSMPMSGASSTYSQSVAQRASRMSIDTRAGIASLMTNNNTLSGLFRHQSIQFLREIASLFTTPGHAPCDWARWIFVPYYGHRDEEGMYADLDDNQDASLEEYIVWLMYHCICDTPGCGQPGRHHARAFIHNTTKVSFAVERDIEGSAEPPTISGELVHWCRCKRCARVSPVSRFSL